ncbi:S1 family peptidase [Pseudomonas sp. MDT1-17]
MEEFEPFEIVTCEMAGAPKNGFCPLAPEPGKPFHPFRIQDPFGLRSAIVPVFRQDTAGRIYGLGTAFNIDEFGSFLTAHHVVDFSEHNGPSRPILFLSMHVLGYGSVPVPHDCFVPVTGFHVAMMDANDPMGALLGKSERKVAIDLAVLKASQLGPGVRSPQTLAVRVEGWQPTIGDVVLAVGFPELDLSELDMDSQKLLLSEGMYGAYGKIVAVHPHGVTTSNPSPVFEVESDWPPGMSGGPVFNRAGEVVGIVSRSIRAESDLPGSGFAVDLGRSHRIQVFAASLDAPGWQVCWGMFSENGNKLLSVHPSDEAAVLTGDSLAQPFSVKKIVNRIGTDEWMPPVSG